MVTPKKFPRRRNVSPLWLAAGVALSLSARAANANDFQDRSNSFQGFLGNETVQVHAPDPSPNAGVVSLADPDVIAPSRSDYDLFRNGIAKAQATHAARLDIPDRVYDLRAPRDLPAGTPVLDLSSLQDIVINGNGATLQFHNLTSRPNIQLLNDQRVVVKQLTVDWAEPLAMTGEFHQGGGSASDTVTIDQPFQVDAENPPDITWMAEYDSTNREFAHQHAWGYDHALPMGSNGPGWRYIGNQTYVMPTDERMAEIPDASPVLLTVASNVPAIAVGTGSDDIAFEDVTVYGSPGAGIRFMDAGRGFRLTRVKIDRRPDNLSNPGDAPRLISTAGDGVDFAACRGDMIVENCDFGFDGRDALSIRGEMMWARKIDPDNRTIKVDHWAPDSFRSGESVTLYHGDSLVPIADATVSHVKFDGHTYTIRLTEPVWDLADQHDVLVSSDYKSDGHFIVRDNDFHDTQNLGILVRGAHGLIDGNTIERTSGSGIQLAAQAGDGITQGPPVRDVVVSDNTLVDTNRANFPSANPQLCAAAIAVYAQTGSGVTDSRANHDIQIANNVIRDVPGLAIRVVSSKNVYVTGNLIHNANAHPFGDPSVDTASVSVERSDLVTLSGNSRDGSSQAYFVDPNTTDHINVQTG